MRYVAVIALSLVLATNAQGQNKSFDWVVANQEDVRLDPGFHHTGRVYRPGSSGGNIHVKIRAERPVTVGMTWVDDWNEARTNPEMASRIRWRCVREHVVDSTYECNLPPSEMPMVLVIHDERVGEGAVLKGVGAVVRGGGNLARAFVSPNDVLVTYHRWDCVQNCVQPEFRWVRLVKEKFELAPTPKVYSLFAPEIDGQQVSVKIKAPVPMTVAVLSTQSADRLYDKPDGLGPALSETRCKQRGIQNMTFECTVDVSSGHQSLFLLPESPNRIPRKKAEIELQAVKCVANCELIEPKP